MPKVILDKWGYKQEEHNISNLIIHYRQGTTDEKVIDEVLIKNAYQKKKIGFLLEPNDLWLDLGANIGTFALNVLSCRGKVIVVEPEVQNLKLLRKNLSTNFPPPQASSPQASSPDWIIIPKCVSTHNGTTKLFLCNGDYNKYRHSMHLNKGRKSINVDTVDIHTILNHYTHINAIKMDIEGEEINILENIVEEYLGKNQIEKMVFEYSFDVDPSIPRFMKIIKKLRKYYSIVHFTKVNPNELEYKYFPPCVNVFCQV